MKQTQHSTSNLQHPTPNTQWSREGKALDVRGRMLNVGCFPTSRCKASVLVGLLWCVALLSVVVFGVLHTTWMDLIMVKNYGDRIQAHYLALAGIEKAKALLYQDALSRSRSDVNHDGALYNDSQDFQDVAFGRGEFTVFRRGRQDEGGGILYGVSDEESRLNLNAAATNELLQLPGMTPVVAAAIVDWRDADNDVSPGGAEAPYYASLQPPRQPRNGPFETVRELLMVRGVTSSLLFGDDAHQNGFLPSAAMARNDFSDAAFHSSDVDSGWAGIVTVDSSINNVSASGQTRVNIQSADEAALTAVPGITPEIARAIVAYRGQHPYQSIADLLDVTAPTRSQPQNQAAPQSSGNQGPNTPNAAQGQSAGPEVINQNLLMDIADSLTANSGQNLPGAIDLNTASRDVLACLPGLDPQLAQAIISYRQSSGFFRNVADLLKVSGMTREIFKQVAPLVSARSETYRILCEGMVNSTGVRQRIQIIVHVGLQDVTTLSYREDNL
ncbi:MAG TPA: helix-hairpin-helix domain-containing protein [Verrucomicrobiae bacterium]|nr:helix-hairpin-helix domain-containing protein [Verrucomicrobiae bacterium]